jgi:hypothetical protein
VYTGDASQDVPVGCKGQELCNQCFYGVYGRLLWPNSLFLTTDGFQRDGFHDFHNIPCTTPELVPQLCVYQWFGFSDLVDPNTGFVNDLFFALSNYVAPGDQFAWGGTYTVNNFVVGFSGSVVTVELLRVRPFLCNFRVYGDWFASLPVFDRGYTIWISEDPL